MAIHQALEASRGSTAEAAKMLGVSRRKIQYRLKEWGVAGGDAESAEQDGGNDADD